MISATPELETRVEGALLRVFRDAFPDVAVYSFTDPGERSGTSLGVKVESQGENPIGTNLFEVSVDIEARNFDEEKRTLLYDMLGNAYNAKETFLEHSSRLFAMPAGQPVEMNGQPRTAENENDRIVSYQLTATIQPL
jgi:hypothetical protein